MKRLPGDPPIEVILRVSNRARRITLRVSHLDGRVTLTRPPWVSETEALTLSADKAAWLRAKSAACPEPRVPQLGATIPVGGVPHEIVAGRPGIGGGTLRVAPGRVVGRQARAILIEAARARFRSAAGAHAATLGRPFGKIALRDTRSRWGSCSQRGDLMFSWRLVMAPASVLDYVAAHEVAHLIRMDHSPAFWDLCRKLCPDWRTERDWLRLHGAGLHAWRFDDT